MTLYHFGNCVALVYAPYYMAYKSAGLSEYGAFWKCVQGGGFYVFTQLCKMLILASFYDSDALIATGDFSFLAEILRCTVDVIDFLGLAVTLSRIPGKGHSKLITAGLGWSAAEVILSRGVMLWSGARGMEFNWIYIFKCLESNLLLMQHIITVTLIWLFTRHDLNKKLKPIVILLLLLFLFKSIWLDGVFMLFQFGFWSILAAKAFVLFVMGFASLYIYIDLAQQIGI